MKGKLSWRKKVTEKSFQFETVAKKCHDQVFLAAAPAEAKSAEAHSEEKKDSSEKSFERRAHQIRHK